MRSRRARPIFFAVAARHDFHCAAVMATLAGTMNAMGWVAVLIYLFSAVGCGYFLTIQSRRLAPL
jgi:hypothetical protein